VVYGDNSQFNRTSESGDFMVAWNLVYGIARATRSLWIKPALEVVDVVASAFEDKEEKKVEEVETEE
jgi:hypothetical protein